MTRQHVRLEEVKAACRLAYAERRLIAFHSEDDYGYHVGKHCCAIGSALTPETAGVLDHMQLGSYTLSDEPEALREVFTWDESEFDALKEIQCAHDQWKMPFTHKDPTPRKEVQARARVNLLRLIDYDGTA